MVGRDVREQPHHHRPQQARDDGQQAAGLRHLHQAEEQRHHADQADRQGDRPLGRLDGAGRQDIHGRRLARGRRYRELPVARDQEGDQHDDKEDDVQEATFRAEVRYPCAATPCRRTRRWVRRTSQEYRH